MELIVVGAGWAGEAHVKAIRALEAAGAGCRLVAVVDTDREHLAAKADQWGLEAAYTDLGQALDSHPDAAGVVLATPHGLHREGAEQAAAAARHVLVEKPIALTLADADAMIAACQRAGTTLMVAESARYGRAAMAIRDVLAAGTLGQPLSGRINRIHRGRHEYSYPGRRAWLADPAAGGSGMWMLNGIHTMSVARMWLGEPARIYACEVHSEKFQGPLEATIVALVTFAGGAQIAITLSAELHGYKRFGDVALFGSDGTLYHRADQDHVELFTETGLPQSIDCRDEGHGEAAGAFVRQMDEFLAATAEGRAPVTSGPSERRTLAAILAGYESVRTGRPADVAG